MIIYSIAVAFSLIVKLLALYFAVIALFALKKRKQIPQRAPHTRFAILLPARNEAAVIGKTVATLQMQNYPGELFDIYVIPNNCTDETETAAREAGAKILFCHGPVHSKGDALRQATDQLMDRHYDAFCVFDADNQVDPEFLRHMNNAFLDGALVAKGRNEAANPYSSWVSGCYGLYFNTYNLFYNQARENLGLSAMLVGTGFAVSRNFLRDIGGFQTQTLTEDAEFAAICARNQVRIHWVPDAVTYDEQPNSFRVSMKQRRRWCSGVVQVAQSELPGLCSNGFHKLKLDQAVYLLSSMACVIALIPNLLTMLLFGFSTVLLFGASAYLALVLGVSLLVLTSGRYHHGIAKSILLFPLFMASWVPLQVMALFRKTTEWEPIAHHGTQPLLPIQGLPYPQ